MTEFPTSLLLAAPAAAEHVGLTKSPRKQATAAASWRDADDIRSLRHGIQALRLAARSDNISSGDLAAVCSVSRAAAYRILQTLLEAGYLQSVGAGNRIRYQLAQPVRELSCGYDGGVLVLDVAIPIMTAWTRQHGWPLAISTPEGQHAICRFATDGVAARVLVRYRAGARMSAQMSASGMVCLAFQPAALQAAAIRAAANEPLPAYAKRRTAAELTIALDRVRREGHATFHPAGLREAGLAVPIWLDGTMSAIVAMRFMLVAEGGAVEHAQRLKMLHALCDRITIEAQARQKA